MGRHLSQLEMLTAIYFDDELRGVADEVDNVRTDRRLPSKCRAVESMRPHRMPDNAFRVRHVLPQRLRASAKRLRNPPARLLGIAGHVVDLVVLASRKSPLPTLPRKRERESQALPYEGGVAVIGRAPRWCRPWSP